MTVELGDLVEILFPALKDFGLVQSLKDVGLKEDLKMRITCHRH